MNYRELTQLDLNLQKKLLSTYKNKLKYLPEGRLELKFIGGKHRYYYVAPKNTKATYTTDQSLIEGIKHRRFIEQTIRRIESNIPRQERFLNNYQNYDYLSVSSSLSPAYSMNIMEQPPSKKFNNEKLPHLTTFGLTVRSKSEALIAELLYAEGIDFEYEKPLRLTALDGSDITIHPDFTITSCGRTIFWEHFGMFKDSSYRNKSYIKLTTYFFNGVSCPENLIISMDSAEGHIDIMAINRIIKSL